MIKNYLKIALRNFSKQKTFSFINISGLAVGLAGALLIFAYVDDELNYDTVHPFAENTYQIGTQYFEEGNENKYAAAPAMWSSQLKEQYPEVKSILRTNWFGYPFSVELREKDKIILTEEMYFVEGNYKDVLYFDIIEGDQENALKETNSIALSESAKNRIFGDETAVGKMLIIKHPFATSNKEINLIVTAVYKDYPDNTHFKPGYLVNMQAMKGVIEWGNYDEMFTNWLGGWMSSYVVLNENANIELIEKGLQKMVHENLGEEQAENFIPFLRNVKDLHFDTEVEWSSEGSGDMTYVYIFGSIALFLILIASINYMNLATARSIKRSREVGLRKVMGSRRSQLIFQFINESFLTTLLSLLFSFVIIFLALPVFNSLAQKGFEFSSFFNIRIIIVVLAVLIIVALLAGSYPAFFLSKFNPTDVLKGGKIKKKGSDTLRKTLVIVQFSISFFMVIGTGVLLKQINFLKNSKLNEQGEQIISVRYGGTAPAEKYPVFKHAVEQDNNINGVTMANHLPRQNYFGGIGVVIKVPEVSDQEYDWSELNVDFNFPKTFDLEFLAGRDFNSESAADSSACLLNESAVKNLGVDISEVLGMTIEDPESDRSATVIGVVKDFPYRSMHQSIGPLRISARPHPVDKIVYIKLPAENMQEHIQKIEAQWKEIYPGIGFDYWFLDQEFGKMYKSETRMSDLTESFSVIAIFIACMGLFGLASYMTEQRTKEIGVRKVLGATVSQILILFISTFLRMLLISAVIAVPFAVFLMNEWLQQFVYHISIDWIIILSAVGLVFGLTVITVGYELLKASTANPVDAIRYE
jgi:putative ABC transport system permease protein